MSWLEMSNVLQASCMRREMVIFSSLAASIASGSSLITELKYLNRTILYTLIGILGFTACLYQGKVDGGRGTKRTLKTGFEPMFFAVFLLGRSQALASQCAGSGSGSSKQRY